ncbi:hypothetical protein GB937_009303 [Aspergillus fischeri]|nr:hypothetical protein GB937_009303 [Aspergillus fischeri]
MATEKRVGWSSNLVGNPNDGPWWGFETHTYFACQKNIQIRAQSTKNTQQQQSQPHANGDSTRQHHVNQEQGPNDTNDEHSDHFDYLPTSLLDMPTDLNLGMDPSSLQADIHPALTGPYGPGGSLHTSQPSCPQPSSHLRTAEQAGQTRWRDAPNPDTSDDLYDFSLPATMRSSFPPTYHRHRGQELDPCGGTGREIRGTRNKVYDSHSRFDI